MNKITIKKLSILVLLAILILSISSLSAYAADDDTEDMEKVLVYDEAGIVPENKIAELNTIANKIENKYQCQVLIVVLNNMDGYDAYEYATSLYTVNDLGYGSDKSGLLLFLSMAARDYAIVAHGYGNVAFTDHGKDVIMDKNVLPLLSEDNFYEAFSVYLSKAEEFLKMAREGTPFDIDTDPAVQNKIDAIKLAVTVLLPLLLAFFICSGWRRKMKTARIANTAENYIPQGGFELTVQNDLFLYRTQTTIKVKDSSSSGGGGGTTIGSGGFSGSSGKF